MSNAKALEEGLKKAREIAFEHVKQCLMDACDDLVDHAVHAKYGWQNFTGNTITSYAIGLFIDGKFVYYYSNNGIKPPVRVKLKKGETVFLNPDYDGRSRSFTGIIDTDAGYGEPFSFEFLKSYKSHTKGIELVMCTGTEYSSYIETVRNGNVLTETFKNAQSILSANFKPMN